jgi:CRP-like cAMP-binding protein
MTDIVERLREAIRDPECPVQFSPVLMAARTEIERLAAALTDLRERSVEEGIQHFVTRIDAALTTGERDD